MTSADRVKHTLSLRAQRALCRLLIPETFFHDELGNELVPEEVGDLTRSQLATRLVKEDIGADPRTLQEKLLRVKLCGRKTTREILTWLGYAKEGFPVHECVCRNCGMKMGQT